jgi:hypothetical protein
MTTTTMLGSALILLGIVAFAYQGITYTTTENILDIGPLQASVDKQETIPLPPIILNPAVASGEALRGRHPTGVGRQQA